MQHSSSSPKSEQDKTLVTLNQEIKTHVKSCLDYCTDVKEKKNFYEVEQHIIKLVFQFGLLLIQLYLLSVQRQFDYQKWIITGNYYLNKKLRYRKLKTFFGELSYGRYYLVSKYTSGGFFPLDKALTLTQDSFSPTIIKMVTNLATRMSFDSAKKLLHRFCGWSPSTESIQKLVLGLGREAAPFMEKKGNKFKDDGEILVIEIDGKATPTATEEELKKRRGKRDKNKCSCGCQRHRGKCKRKKNKKKKKKKGDKSKNGRSITLVAMYTLKKGEDGLLHGPINKVIWGSYAARIDMMIWAKEQAIKRGFNAQNSEQIHIVIDGELTLYKRLSELFKKASFALDIRHLEEKLWDVGRALYKSETNEDRAELEQWIETHRSLLYEGKAKALLEILIATNNSLSKRAKKDEKKKEKLEKIIGYMKTRLSMMDYKKLIDADMVIASGVIEGAARYVVGERMDCSGMRWIPQKAEALLHLRCIELNGDWDKFFDWTYNQWADKLNKGENILLRTNEGINLGKKYDKTA